MLGLGMVVTPTFALTPPVSSPEAVPDTVIPDRAWWPVQAIDTMKYSRDRSREFLGSSSSKVVIDEHVRRIAETGATHVSIGTPYDEEFVPILEEWVGAARKYNLHVWFRGNWSGWEEWFDYPAISREEHIAKTVRFIEDHPKLFEDGDIFQACPECENGGPGDPRHTGGVAAYRTFLIDEHQAVQRAFSEIRVSVDTRYNSMNGDVARLIMDPETTQALGGLIVVDHYVESPAQLAADIAAYAQQSGGSVVLGEFGAPIPDIHGKMSEQAQAAWLDELFSLLTDSPDLVGMNYWTDTGSSTELWYDSGVAKSGVETVTEYYRPEVVENTVVDPNGKAISGITIRTLQRTTTTSLDGSFVVPYTKTTGNVVLTKAGYIDQVMSFNDFKNHAGPIVMELDLLSPSAVTIFLQNLSDRLLRYLLFRF